MVLSKKCAGRCNYMKNHEVVIGVWDVQQKLQHFDALPRWMWHMPIPGQAAAIPSVATIPTLRLTSSSVLLLPWPALLLPTSVFPAICCHLSSPHSSNDAAGGGVTLSRTIEPHD
ncbi:hypothetical protein PR048_022077 [Dryococelus australis]|uniref:Uncharacterized protein n=1 Tax=Dryococelus australis TaxID=614101 RepID=A0ABQ9H010_9NEOP|nr:hypothetical protein PR048_022077 [Dryococelus australis]